MESARRLNLAEVLVAAPERAARTAVREPARSWTYGELAHKVRCVAVGARPSFHAVRADSDLPSLEGQSLETIDALVDPARAGAAVS